MTDLGDRQVAFALLKGLDHRQPPCQGGHEIGVAGKRWMRFAGEATIGGASAGELGRDASGLADSLAWVWSLIAYLKKSLPCLSQTSS